MRKVNLLITRETLYTSERLSQHKLYRQKRNKINKTSLIK